MKRRIKTENAYFMYDRPYEQTARAFITGIKEYMAASVRARLYELFMNVWYPVNVTKKRYDVALCAIFKNEADYLKEWIEYHRIAGVSHFYLYNNFSQDDYQTVLAPYIASGDVTLTDWPYPQGQMAAYKDCVRKAGKESRWIGFVDLDEFVVPVDDDHLYDFLKKFEKNRGSVLMYWKIFGSGGRMRRDLLGLVTEDFTVSWNKHTDIGKCFYNTAYDFIPDYKKNGLIHHSMWTGCRGKALPPVNCFNRVCFERYHPAKGDHFPVRINHYFTKSLEEWKQGKQVKGDVYFKENPHDEAYFLRHEYRCGAVDVRIYKYLIRLKQAMNPDGKV